MTSAGDPHLRKGRTRLDVIDLLRGLAIFFVLMNHVNMRIRLAGVPYTDGLPHQLVSTLIWNGQRGVQIFFALSGFLITSTSIRRWGFLAMVNTRGFYLLRLARIAPLLLALLAVLSLLDLIHVNNFQVSPKTGGLGRALIAALTFHTNVLEANRGYLPGNWDILWSLSIEEVFYLAFPLCCALFGHSKFLIVVLFGLVVLGPFGRTTLTHQNPVWQEYSYLGGMDAIALGCLTAILVSKMELTGPTTKILVSLGSTLLVFSLFFSNWAVSLGLSRSGLAMTIIGVGTCMIVAAAAQTDWISPPLLQPLLKLGQLSYEVYLTHMFVVFAFFELFVSAGKPRSAVPGLFIAIILISGFLGAAIARFYSDPMNRFLRRWLLRAESLKGESEGGLKGV